MSDTPKKTFGKYEAISHLGSGAMGVVWRAQDPVLGRTVAIKTISAALGSDNENKERFLREARAAAQLNHPNITQVYDIEEEENLIYLVMEYVDGESLESVIDRLQRGDPAALRQYDTPRRIEILLGILRALSFAHERGVAFRQGLKKPSRRR